MKKDPVKKDPEEIFERCERLIEANRDRDSIYEAVDKLYFGDVPRETPNEAVERIHMPYATAVVDLIADLASLMDVHIEVPAANESASAQRAADDIEYWLRAWFNLNQRNQQRNIISEAAWLAAQRAAVAMRTLYVESDESGGKVPVVLQVRDPRYVYPQYGVHGLRYVVERYQRPIHEIAELYPDAVPERANEEDTVEWTEYWDKDVRCYWVDGKPVEIDGETVVEHGYGCIPYSIGYARTTPFRSGRLRYRPVLSAVTDLAHIIDISFSLLATAGTTGAVAAWAVFSDAQRDLDLRPGAVNQFRREDRVEPVQRAALPADFFQFITSLLQLWQAMTVPFSLFGQSPGNLAGYAISLLSQSGRRVIFPIWRAVQECLAGAMRNALLICREKVADKEGNEIALVVMADGDKRKIKRKVRLNTELIGDDFDLTVYLDDPMPQDEAANVRMAIETTQAKLLSRQTALTKFKIVPDPLGEMDRIVIEDVYGRLAPFEGLRLASERGYLPTGYKLPAGWKIMPDGTILPEAILNNLVGEQQAQQPQQVVQQQPMEQTTGVNPADMQAIAGEAPPVALTEMAGEPPPPPQNQYIGGTNG